MVDANPKTDASSDAEDVEPPAAGGAAGAVTLTTGAVTVAVTFAARVDVFVLLCNSVSMAVLNVAGDRAAPVAVTTAA